MKQLRQVLLWAVLGGVSLLLVLSIIGAFLGDERARVLFNSLPLAVFWILLLGLLVVGLLYFKRLIRSPGLLGVHLGSLLILAGAMYGSDAGHALAAKLFDSKKIPSADMQIFESQTENRVMATGETQFSRLPFRVGLKDFWIEYYQPWPLIARTLTDDQDGRKKWERNIIDWTKGQDVAIPNTKIRLRVLEYLETARPIYAGGFGRVLEITQPDGKKNTIPAQVGQELVLEEPHLHLRIARVFSNLKVQTSGKEHQVINMPGPPTNPALKIHIDLGDGQKTHRYVYPFRQMHDQEEDKFKFRYLFTEPEGAEHDPDSHQPAMEILLKYKDKEHRHWLIVDEGQHFANLCLAELLDTEVDEHEQHPYLRLNEPGQREIREFKSDLVVLEEGQIVKSKIIELNDPLHYGGYHFYQYKYDGRAARLSPYTVLSVTSDSGLTMVWLGFILLTGGVFWLFWFKPIWVYFTKRRDDGD